ncbi:response regulator [Paenalcaligenes niemegkensis]|uniref:response regulator n=1 Tax=Paenalcaligenes niemegkensis TaxID=2895469 RepID=UPI001EE83936|nr:response regulator [Paenalcaligenes niemegkensis]MCQ9616025.1 response regulator [Paenalcaligenes niemegkensis]
MTPTILIVEDEPKLVELLALYLQAEHFQTVSVGDGTEVRAAIQAHQPDLVLLDLMLPGKDGLAVCKDIRQHSDLPIIMVTAKVEELDRLLGLELGADDYICKPYSPREVVARVKAVLRRRRTPQSNAGSEHSALYIDESTYTAKLDGVLLDLTPVEFRLFALFARSPGHIYSRDRLLALIYDDHRIVTDRTVDSHIKNLRRKLQAIRPEQDLIKSIYGVGYRYEDDPVNSTT